jgi:hypothetical protein
MINIKVNTTKARVKVQNTERKSDVLAQRTVEALKEMGKSHAKLLAPKDTGKMAGMIRGIVSKKANGWQALILSPNPTKSDGHRRKIKNFNLARWAAESQRALTHFRSPGKARYMQLTVDYLNKYKKQVARGHFKNK